MELLHHFTNSIRLNPTDNSAYYNRADVKATLKDYKGAIKDCNKALELVPNDYRTYFNRGLYYSKISDLKKAVADYDKTISLNSKFIPAYRQRGVTYSKLNNYESSLKDFNVVISYYSGKVEGVDDNNPNNKAGDYFNRAVAKLNLGDKIGACKDAEMAKELGYPTQKLKHFSCK